MRSPPPLIYSLREGQPRTPIAVSTKKHTRDSKARVLTAVSTKIAHYHIVASSIPHTQGHKKKHTQRGVDHTLRQGKNAAQNILHPPTHPPAYISRGPSIRGSRGPSEQPVPRRGASPPTLAAASPTPQRQTLGTAPGRHPRRRCSSALPGDPMHLAHRG